MGAIETYLKNTSLRYKERKEDEFRSGVFRSSEFTASFASKIPGVQYLTPEQAVNLSEKDSFKWKKDNKALKEKAKQLNVLIQESKISSSKDLIYEIMSNDNFAVFNNGAEFIFKSHNYNYNGTKTYYLGTENGFKRVTEKSELNIIEICESIKIIGEYGSSAQNFILTGKGAESEIIEEGHCNFFKVSPKNSISINCYIDFPFKTKLLQNILKLSSQASEYSAALKEYERILFLFNKNKPVEEFLEKIKHVRREKFYNLTDQEKDILEEIALEKKKF